MTIKNKKVKDKEKILFNPITGKLDLALEFNPDRIITHTLNAAGHDLMLYNPGSGQHMSMDPLVVIDNDGNVVMVG